MKKYLIALVMIVMIMSCFFGKTLVMANEESDDTVYNRYYTTIEVEKVIHSGRLQKLIITTPVCRYGNTFMS